MNFSDYCQMDWPDTDRAAEFLQRAGERVGLVIENVQINPGGISQVAGRDTAGWFSKQGLHISTREPEDAELAYGTGLLTIGAGALKGEEVKQGGGLPSKENQEYEDAMNRDFGDTLAHTRVAAQFLRGMEVMTKVLPGTRKVMELSLTKLILPHDREEAANENPQKPTLRFDRVLAGAAAGDQTCDPDGKIRQMMQDGESADEIANAVMDVCRTMGEIEDENGVDPNAAVDPEAQHAVTEEEYAKTIVRQASASSGVSTEKWASEKETPGSKITEDSLASAIFREVMTEDRIEREAGHYSGLVTQPTRMFSDYRMMARRLVQEETPDSLFVLLVDNSGSMNSGERWTIACAIHDGVMKAFHDLNVPAISAAFNQIGGEKVHPICKQGTDPVHLSQSVRVGGGTGDLAAMGWATRQLDESGKKGRVVLVISDAEGPTDVSKMKRATKLLNANVVHVDVTGRGYNCYGIPPISLTKAPDAEFYRDLASRLRHALELQGEVEG